MRLWLLEMQSILKTRSVRIILALLLVATLGFAYLPVSYVQYAYQTPQGEVKLSGLAAVKQIKADLGEEAVAITPEYLTEALASYQEALDKYGEDGIIFDMPDSEYSRAVFPYAYAINRLKEVYADSETGLAPEVTELNAAHAQNFYEQLEPHLNDLMRMEQKDHPAAQQAALEMYSQRETPFYDYRAFSTDAVDYLVLLTVLIVFCAIIIAAPSFAGGYQSGADDILRCTRHGRWRLAVVKITVMFTLAAVMLLVFMGVYLLLSNTLFGWQCTRIALQMRYSAVTPPALNLGQAQLLMLGASLLTILATVGATLWISAKSKNTVTALAFSLGLFLLPILSYVILPTDALANWVQVLLPSGSVGLGNNFLYTLWGFQFLHIGGFSIYVPWAIMLAAAVEIPLFAGLAAWSYQKHCTK